MEYCRIHWNEFCLLNHLTNHKLWQILQIDKYLIARLSSWEFLNVPHHELRAWTFNLFLSCFLIQLTLSNAFLAKYQARYLLTRVMKFQGLFSNKITNPRRAPPRTSAHWTLAMKPPLDSSNQLASYSLGPIRKLRSAILSSSLTRVAVRPSFVWACTYNY